MKNDQHSTNRLYCVKDNLLASDFPDVNRALREPNGLLAIGGDLTINRLLAAYQQGIFPWFNEGQPILWWSPDPRCVLDLTEIKISRSLKKRIRKNEFKITYNKSFIEVLEGCSDIRNGIRETWITDDIKYAYIRLFENGYAHSVECWKNEQLIGGLYGLALGKVFFGESMFSRETDASKVALVHLVQQLKRKEFKLIDCQVYSKHLHSMGAKLIHREMFIPVLKSHCNMDKTTDWI